MIRRLVLVALCGATVFLTASKCSDKNTSETTSTDSTVGSSETPTDTGAAGQGDAGTVPAGEEGTQGGMEGEGLPE